MRHHKWRFLTGRVSDHWSFWKCWANACPLYLAACSSSLQCRSGSAAKSSKSPPILNLHPPSPFFSCKVVAQPKHTRIWLCRTGFESGIPPLAFNRNGIFSIFPKIRLSLLIGCDYRNYHNFFSLQGQKCEIFLSKVISPKVPNLSPDSWSQEVSNVVCNWPRYSTLQVLPRYGPLQRIRESHNYKCNDCQLYLDAATFVTGVPIVWIGR